MKPNHEMMKEINISAIVRHKVYLHDKRISYEIIRILIDEVSEKIRYPIFGNIMMYTWSAVIKKCNMQK